MPILHNNTGSLNQNYLRYFEFAISLVQNVTSKETHGVWSDPTPRFDIHIGKALTGTRTMNYNHSSR